MFPRRNNKIKAGDATKAEIAESTMDTTSVNTLPKGADAVTFAPVTEVHLSLTVLTMMIYCAVFAAFIRCSITISISHSDKAPFFLLFNSQELKSFKAYSALRAARADSRLVGVRAKKAKDGKEDAPVAEKE